MTFANKPSNTQPVEETDFKMTFAKGNKQTTTNNTGSGLFMNVASDIKSNNTNKDGLFMNVTRHKLIEKVRDPKILRFESDDKINNVDDDNPNILKVIR